MPYVFCAKNAPDDRSILIYMNRQQTDNFYTSWFFLSRSVLMPRGLRKAISLQYIVWAAG